MLLPAFTNGATGIPLPANRNRTDNTKPRPGQHWTQSIGSLAMRHRNAGFTLIELVTTLSVMAICAGIALPSMEALIERQRASAAVGSLMSHMALARMAAISRNQRAVLCPSDDGLTCLSGTDWSRGWMLFLDEDGNRIPDANEEILRTDLEPTSRHLRVVSTVGRQQLRYLPDGRSAGTNLTVSICNKRSELLAAVIVNNMGRPRSERPKAPTSCPG